MLPKMKRLTSSDFTTRTTKIVFRGTFVDIAVSPSNSSTELSRFACIIAKKKVKSAVDRNRIRRRIYSLLETIETKKIQHVVVYSKNTVLTAPFQSIKEELHRAFATL